MGDSIPFRLNRSGVMLVLVSAAFAGEAGAAAGRAEFTIGGVTVSGKDGVQRPLARGTELDNGDVVRTNNGRAQIRFTDGAYVSLQPNTEYGIRDYQYTQGNERGFFSLLKGAMRTVTGAIGRINRDRYQIATPTATVGIRGTGGVIQVQDDGSTLVIGTSGIWSLTNPAGSVDVPAGNSAVAPSDPNQPPQETTQQPTSGPAPVPEKEPIFVAGEERTEEGLPVVPERAEEGLPVVPTPTLAPLVSGSGYTVSVSFDQTLSSPHVVSGGSVSAVFDTGQLTSMTFPDEIALNTHQFSLDQGATADFGTDGILAWGRWTGQTTVTTDNCQVACPPISQVYDPANEGLHYVVGMPTPTLPVSGTATYALIGATRPTYGPFTGVGPGAFTGSMTVTFGTPTPTIGANFNVAMPDRTYALTFSPNRVGMSGSIFTFSPSVAIGGSPCSTCSSLVEGFFAGASAERAGVSYHIGDNNNFVDVYGAAAFTKQ